MRKRLGLSAVGMLLLALFAMPGAADAARDALLNERLSVPGDGETYGFVFTPTSNNVYEFGFFGEGSVRATLSRVGEDTAIAQADDGFQARLTANQNYRLDVTSTGGDVDMEIMRAALGRCFDKPIELVNPETGYDKTIARAYDTHWYRLIAPEDGLYIIRTVSDINTVGYLLDENGRRLAGNDNLYAPYELDFRLHYPLRAGQTVYVRVSGRGEETGAYRLLVRHPANGEPLASELALSPTLLTLTEGEKQTLTTGVTPENAFADAVFLSTNPAVATVSPSGKVTARRAGEAQIICVGAGETEARATVVVEPMRVTGIELTRDAATLHVGEIFTPAYEIEPETASNRAVRLDSSDPSVARVSADNRLVAVSPGQTTVTLTTEDGAYQATLRVRVKAALPLYRVLTLGEQRYTDGRVRIGSVNTTQGVTELFKRQRYDVRVTSKLDSSCDEALAAIQTAFAGALETDVSVLYVTAHGGLTNGVAWLEFHDGSRLTATRLERALRDVRGTVVLLIDCCQSGGFISPVAARAFTGRMAQAFSGTRTPFSAGKYHLLTSTSAAQDSYRISYDGGGNEESMATAFARALCEAGGFDLIGDKPMRMRGDFDQDGTVTLYEAYRYVSARVSAFLKTAAVAQDVQWSSQEPGLALFQK